MQIKDLSTYSKQGILPRMGEPLGRYIQRAEKTLRVLDDVNTALYQGKHVAEIDSRLADAAPSSGKLNPGHYFVPPISIPYLNFDKVVLPSLCPRNDDDIYDFDLMWDEDFYMRGKYDVNFDRSVGGHANLKMEVDGIRIPFVVFRWEMGTKRPNIGPEIRQHELTHTIRQLAGLPSSLIIGEYEEGIAYAAEDGEFDLKKNIPNAVIHYWNITKDSKLDTITKLLPKPLRRRLRKAIFEQKVKPLKTRLNDIVERGEIEKFPLPLMARISLPEFLNLAEEVGYNGDLEEMLYKRQEKDWRWGLIARESL